MKEIALVTGSSAGIGFETSLALGIFRKRAISRQ
jgi:NAD(P)-dependent dehydrogenase (short-subunit alcohol dehydrogenase family)